MDNHARLSVAMVNKYYSPPHLGGVEVVVRRLSEALVREAGARVQALVANEAAVWVEETIAGVQVTRLPRQLSVSSSPVAATMPSALRRLSQSGTDASDIVNLHSPYPWGELSFLMARPEVPSVVLYHSDIVRQRRLLAAYRPFLERFLGAVDLIMVSSPQMIANSPFLQSRAAKCRVIPFGLPPEYFEPGQDVLERASVLRGRHRDRLVVLFVGRLVYYKGIDVLVRAMAGVDGDLVVIGSGPLEAAVQEVAAANGVAGRLTLLPPQGEAELLAWYRAADVLCLPSVASSEAFGLVQIEAHAAGTPVVSTDLPTGVPYANLDGLTGLTVPPGDADALAAALRRLLGDDELRARLGSQARERALAEFTVARMVDEVLQVYAEAVDVHAGRQGTCTSR
jgi:glycosyltransferase involved in cell wall biosynthesis